MTEGANGRITITECPECGDKGHIYFKYSTDIRTTSITFDKDGDIEDYEGEKHFDDYESIECTACDSQWSSPQALYEAAKNKMAEAAKA